MNWKSDAFTTVVKGLLWAWVLGVLLLCVRSSGWDMGFYIWGVLIGPPGALGWIHGSDHAMRILKGE